MINQSLIKNPEIENKLKSNVKISKVSKITDKEKNLKLSICFHIFAFCILYTFVFLYKYFYTVIILKNFIQIK